MPTLPTPKPGETWLADIFPVEILAVSEPYAWCRIPDGEPTTYTRSELWPVTR